MCFQSAVNSLLHFQAHSVSEPYFKAAKSSSEGVISPVSRLWGFFSVQKLHLIHKHLGSLGLQGRERATYLIT